MGGRRDIDNERYDGETTKLHKCRWLGCIDTGNAGPSIRYSAVPLRCDARQALLLDVFQPGRADAGHPGQLVDTGKGLLFSEISDLGQPHLVDVDDLGELIGGCGVYVDAGGLHCRDLAWRRVEHSQVDRRSLALKLGAVGMPMGADHDAP